MADENMSEVLQSLSRRVMHVESRPAESYAEVLTRIEALESEASRPLLVDTKDGIISVAEHIVEVRVWHEDAAATIRNVLQCLDDTKVINRALMTRVEALEAWNREGGVVYGLGTKLSNLEDQHEEDRTTIYGQLGEAEEKLEELESHRVFAVDREYDRQARWHNTYDAALPQCMNHPLDETHRLASAIADRAHGPLEAKEATYAERDYALRVTALVKAAREMLNHTSISEEIPRDFDDALESALKPFEGVS